MNNQCDPTPNNTEDLVINLYCTFADNLWSMVEKMDVCEDDKKTFKRILDNVMHYMIVNSNGDGKQL